MLQPRLRVGARVTVRVVGTRARVRVEITMGHPEPNPNPNPSSSPFPDTNQPTTRSQPGPRFVLNRRTRPTRPRGAQRGTVTMPPGGSSWGRSSRRQSHRPPSSASASNEARDYGADLRAAGRRRVEAPCRPLIVVIVVRALQAPGHRGSAMTVYTLGQAQPFREP